MHLNSFIVCDCGNNIFLLKIENAIIIYTCTHCKKTKELEICENAN